MCALALVHVPSLAPVLAEFARVLRLGGHLVISDVDHELVLLGSVINAPWSTHPASGRARMDADLPPHRR